MVGVGTFAGTVGSYVGQVKLRKAIANKMEISFGSELRLKNVFDDGT